MVQSPDRCKSGQTGRDHRRSSLAQVPGSLNDYRANEILRRHKTFLSAVTLPFAFYASEVLSDWLRRRGALATAIAAALAALLVCSAMASTFNGAFEKTEVSGLSWQDDVTNP